MELAFDIAPNSTLGLDFAGALQLTVNRDGPRLSRRGLADGGDASPLLARRGATPADLYRPLQRGDFHQRWRGGDEQPLLPGLSGAAHLQRCDAGGILPLAAAAMHGRISVLLSGSRVLMKTKRVTIKDIAELAGVPKATASPVLNGRGKELRVAQETRERVPGDRSRTALSAEHSRALAAR